MEVDSRSSSAFAQAQHSLKPYVKTREETAHIRRVLAAFLESQVDQQGSFPRSGPLSLQDGSVDIKPLPSTARGLRKEYLKCLRANVKARQEYERLKIQHVSSASASISTVADASGQLEDYITLVKQRQRLERLRILQNYIDSFAQKSAAISSFGEGSKSAFESVPRVPAEVVNAQAAVNDGSAKSDLNSLVRDLERSVFKAKAFLKTEKQALSKAQSDASNRQSSRGNVLPADQQKLQALSQTRNELISWVEEELGKAGDDEHAENDRNDTSEIRLSVEEQLSLVKSQYSSYIEARKAFLVAAADSRVPSKPQPTEQFMEDATKDESTYTTSTLLPFLEELLEISNEQKSFIQQRSYLTVSLAKQHKETIQTFDRLADESHLLPAFPMPGSQSSRRDYGTSTTFSEEMGRKEIPNVSDRARAWTFAAASAATNTKDVVIEQVEEGTLAIDESRQTLAAIEILLGRRGLEIKPGSSVDDIWMASASDSMPTPSSDRGNADENSTDLGELWISLNGNLGVIGRGAVR